MYNNFSKKKLLFINISMPKIVFGVIILFIASQIYIPIQPIPFTLQTVAVITIALIYSRKDAIITILCYVALGAIGVPVFAGYNGGVNILFGPTGGYIFGFIFCIQLMGLLRKKFGEGIWLHSLIYASIGHSVICILGALYLANFIGILKAIEKGLLPFILPAIIKIILAVFFAQLIKKGLEAKYLSSLIPKFFRN